MRSHRVGFAFCILVLAAVVANRGATTAPAVSRPSTLPAEPVVLLDRGELEKMYRAELGGLYDAGQYSRIYDAHGLLEDYFASTSSAQRKWFVGQIDDLGLDRAVVGKIARIHLDWPALAAGVYYVNEKVGPHEVKYFFGVPQGYDRARAWPLVIKLPTGEAFTTDPKPDADRVAQIYSQWVMDEMTAHPDAIVLMPLLNLDFVYGPSATGMNLAIQPMLHITSRVNINPAQVYLMGHSAAAHAVWNLAIHYPTYFSAIMPLEGSAPLPWQRLRMGNLRNVLPVVWHDTSDQVVKVAESREIVEFLRKMKYDVDYTETTDLGHMPSPQVLADAYGKMRGRTRDLYPRETYIQSNKPETIYNRADWVQVYQPLETGSEQKFLVEHSGEYMLMDQRNWRVQGDIIGPNVISLKTQNVQILRIYLNDQMVDLSKPVTVLVNDKQRFSGIIPQSTEEMLKDEMFLGRGWRYFTAVLDMDLLEPASQPTTRGVNGGTGAATEPEHRGSIEVTLPNGEKKVYEPK